MSQDTKDERWIWAISVPIVIFVAIALVWAVGFWSPPMTSEEELTEVELRNPVSKAKFINGEDYWDLTVELSKIQPKDAKILWVEVRVRILSEGEHVLKPDTRVKPDDPAAYDDGSDGWVDVQVWYICTPAHDPHVHAGHIIKVTGISKEFEGGTVVISKSGEQIGTLTIPSLTV